MVKDISTLQSFPESDLGDMSPLQHWELRTDIEILEFLGCFPGKPGHLLTLLWEKPAQQEAGTSLRTQLGLLSLSDS